MKTSKAKKNFMNEKRIKKLISSLSKILSNLSKEAFLVSTASHGYNAGGIWTGMGESGICDYYTDPSFETLPSQIKTWLDKEELFLEWQNPGVVCIWSAR
tara:strand:- start:325 stop:624 length:300 start_codon:yes stop_codon:yes gene_type:complete